MTVAAPTLVRLAVCRGAKVFGLFKPKPMTATEAETIINAYGAVMMAKPTVIADQRDLPYSKEKIKEALRIGIASTTDPKLIDMLKAGYVTLADFLLLTDDERFVLKQQSILEGAGFDPANATLIEVKRWIAHYAAYRPLVSRVEANAWIAAHEIGSEPPVFPKMPDLPSVK